MKPTAEPVYQRFTDERVCAGIQFDLLEELGPLEGRATSEMVGDGFAVSCHASYGGAGVTLTGFVFDSPQQSEQGDGHKGFRPGLSAGVDYGDLKLDARRAEWTAAGKKLTGLAFDGNLKLQVEISAPSAGGHPSALVEPLTVFMAEALKEFRRMATAG